VGVSTRNRSEHHSRAVLDELLGGVHGSEVSKGSHIHERKRGELFKEEKEKGSRMAPLNCQASYKGSEVDLCAEL
jgi:hypothetical protein